jgi:tmRNA-binding protein
MASKAITDMVIKRKKKSLLRNRTQVAHIVREHTTNWATAKSWRLVPLMRHMQYQWRKWEIKLCIMKKQWSVYT